MEVMENRFVGGWVKCILIEDAAESQGRVN